MVLARREASRDAELLVLRHENAVLRRHTGRVRYQPAGRLWLAALSRLIPRRGGEGLAVTPAALLARPPPHRADLAAVPDRPGPRHRGRLRPPGHRAPAAHLRPDRHRARHPPGSPG